MEVDVRWEESIWTILERESKIASLEARLAEAHLRCAATDKMLAASLVRSGQFEGCLGVEMMYRIKHQKGDR